MEIKRLKDNQIRCALTEDEIEDMGFSIDDIIGNGETTQKFMRVVLEKIEEEEQIDTTLLSPMVRAELMPDHSMTITFGGITEEEKKGMFGKILEMMEQMKEKRTEVSQKQEKEAAAFDEKCDEEEGDDTFTEPTQLGLEFENIDDAIRISKLFMGKESVPKSSFYKMDGKYYLFMDVTGFLKKEVKPVVFMAMEYTKYRMAELSRIAYVKEHGKCVIEKDAILSLIQL